MLHTHKIIADPEGSVVPESRFEQMHIAVRLGMDVTKDTFASANQYMSRIGVEMQVLFIDVVASRPYKEVEAIQRLPEYINVFKRRDVVLFIGGANPE